MAHKWFPVNTILNSVDTTDVQMIRAVPLKDANALHKDYVCLVTSDRSPCLESLSQMLWVVRVSMHFPYF